MKSLNDIGDVKGKKVLVRVDFNVPVEDSKVVQTYKIKAHKKTIDYLSDKGAAVGLVSHISKVDSFESIYEEISKIFNREIIFAGDIFKKQNVGEGIFLFENIRKHKEETENDKNFAKNLADGFDFYINDAFSVLHRAHASVSAITEFLPSYAGFLIEKETKSLSEIKDKPNKVLILGGAKVDTKVPLIKDLLGKYEKILLGGVAANVFFQVKGFKIGSSSVDNAETLVKGLELDDSRLILPEDIVISTSTDGKKDAEILPLKDLSEGHYILDVGPETVKRYSEVIRDSETVVWNGSLGLAEVEKFSYGTKMILDSVINSEAKSLIGGGDMVVFVEKHNLLDKISYISTGGGAMLMFLADKELPGLKALNFYA